MSTTPVSPSYYADFRGLDALKKSARENNPQALRQVARQFESLLTSMLLKSMREAKLGDGLGDSQETAFYQDMLDQQVAVQLSQGKGMGLADMLVQQLARSGIAGPAAAPGVATVPSAGATPLATPQAPSTAAVPVRERAAFVRQIEPLAERAARQLGVAPEALIAHAALETGWGRHVPSAAAGGSTFNLFGIKANPGWNGQSVSARTVEYDATGPSNVRQPFRSYSSLEQGMNDYVGLLTGNGRYRAALGTGQDTSAFASGLVRGGYATDPVYGSKLAAVAEQVRALRSAGAPEPARVASLEQSTLGGSRATARSAT
jgi:flagellar protein FlgJ